MRPNRAPLLASKGVVFAAPGNSPSSVTRGLRRCSAKMARIDMADSDRNWVSLFGQIGQGVRTAVLDLYGTEGGRRKLAIGAGGDSTLELDRVAEAHALTHLEAAAAGGLRFTVVSEEVGVRNFGADVPVVLLDPIDGSTNAGQGLPIFAVMLSLVDEPRPAGVRVGYILDVVGNTAWVGIRGGGVFQNGRRVQPKLPTNSDRILVVGFEGTAAAVIAAAQHLDERVEIRDLGSMATSLALAATGGLDAVCAPAPMRIFDMSAGLLLLREVGGVVTDIGGRSIDELRIDLNTRTTLLAASTPRAHAIALALLERGRDR